MAVAPPQPPQPPQPPGWPWYPPQKSNNPVFGNVKTKRDRSVVGPVVGNTYKDYGYNPRDRSIKGKTANTFDKYVSGGFSTWFFRLIFISPIILSGIYLSTKNEGSENFNLVLAGLILYSIFGGYFFLDIINERYRKYILLLGMTIGSFIVFIIALSRDSKNGLMTSIVVLTGITLFILFVYNVTLLKYSAYEILNGSPTVGNYIVKLDSIKNEPGYRSEKFSSDKKEEMDEYRKKLLRILESTGRETVEYRNPTDPSYIDLQKLLDDIDSKFLGTDKMWGVKDEKIPRTINIIKGTGPINDYLYKYQTDRSIYKGYIDEKNPKK